MKTSIGTTAGSQVLTSARNVVMVRAPLGSTAAKVVASTKTQPVTLSASAVADKLKPKGFTGISRYDTL